MIASARRVEKVYRKLTYVMLQGTSRFDGIASPTVSISECRALVVLMPPVRLQHFSCPLPLTALLYVRDLSLRSL